MSQNRGGTKRALLIGISDYPYPHWKLDGCSNDMALMYRALTDRFGFPRGNITTLKDEEATRDGILAALDELVDTTDRDDIVVIHYAGHGSQMTCLEGDEPDGLDETLIPYDSGRDPDENRDITDDEIHLILQRLGEKTSYTTLIFDCCHSGTITRDAFGGKTRSVAKDKRSARELLKTRAPVPAEVVTRSTRNPGPSGWLSLSEKYVLIAGCADDEQSAEKPVGDDTFGALTWYLARELDRARAGTTYRDVFEAISGRVTGNCAAQHPQMEGKLDRELFGVRDIEPMRYVPVRRTEGAIALGAGAAQGITVGSRWAIVAPGTAEVTEETERIAEVEIASVDVVESRVTVVAGDAESVPDGSRAIETAHAYGEQRLRCEILAPEDDPSAARIREGLEGSNVLATAEGAMADVRIYVLEPRSDPGPDGDVPVPQLGGTDRRTLVVVGEQGELVVPVERLGGRGDEGEDERALVDNLETLARYRLALAIRNEDPVSKLHGAVEMEIFREMPDGRMEVAEPESAGGGIVFEEGEFIGLRITNTSSEPLYVNLLDFDPAGAVTAPFPPPGSNDVLAPGESVDHDVLRFGAKLPEKMPGAALSKAGGPVEGMEILKLVVTRQPADFSFFNQAAFRSADAGDAEASPLELLVRSAAGVTTRSLSYEPKTPAGDWSTVEKTLVIREKSAEPLSADGTEVRLAGAASSRPGEVMGAGGVTVISRGLEARVVRHGWESSRAEALQLASGRLGDALASTSVETRQTLEIDGARASEPAMRGAGLERPEVELRLADPGSEHGQMLLSAGESGLLRWHFPEPDGEGSAGGGEEPRMRGAGDRGPAERRFVVDATVEPKPEGPKRRGLVGAVGKKFIKELVFPLMDPVIGKVGDHFAGRFEAARRPYRLRTFTPEDHLSPDAEVIASDDSSEAELWSRLAEGPSLLLVHGAFSRSHTGFGSLPPDFVAELHRRYGGRVFAFDHHTLSDDPRQNAEWLLRHLPPDTSLEVDVLAHARGGLVARALAERQGDLSAGGNRLRVGKVVFAGAPNAGTELADPKHLGALIDRYTNLLNLFDFIPIDTGVVEVLELIVSVGKQLALGTMKGLDGLRAMAPEGAFRKWLDEASGAEGVRYFALASDFRPVDGVARSLAASTVARKIFSDAPNDLVVPTRSVFDRRRAPRPGEEGPGGALFPITDQHVFEGRGLAHFDYFGHAEAREKIAGWLGV